MFPLSVITWRLGKIDSDKYEHIIPDGEQKQLVLNKCYRITQSIFYLETCQRVILVIEENLDGILQELLNEYFKILGISDRSNLEPEVFSGRGAVYHLAKVIAGLDSVVLGEYEIQHQFKEAYQCCKPYMGSNLITYLQYIIRIGKRVRQNLTLSRTSTIELVEQLYQKRFKQVQQVAIIGTGRMGKLIASYLDQYAEKITIYSTAPTRAGQHLNQFVIQPLDQLQGVELIISASGQPKFINPKFLAEHQINAKTLLIDLGMPRNCTTETYQLEQVEVINIEELVDKASTTTYSPQIKQALDVIRTEVDQIITDYQHQLRSKFIIKLRSDLTDYAQYNRPDFVDDGDHKAYNQFVNAMIHISQKHIEKIIFEGGCIND